MPEIEQLRASIWFSQIETRSNVGSLRAVGKVTEKNGA